MAEEYLVAQRAKASPDLVELWSELETYYKRKYAPLLLAHAHCKAVASADCLSGGQH